MAKVLLTWELGAGSGHFVNLRPFVAGLEAKGHKVYVALRDLCRGPALLGGRGVSFLQSPYKSDAPRNPIQAPRTFADVLHNIGFGDAEELAVLADAWGSLIDWIDPQLIIFDHSPTALLAARGHKARRVLLGNSFSTPPDCSPFPDLRPWLPGDPKTLYQTEGSVLENVNRVLRARGQPALERLGQLYGEVDEVILTTLAEFDHYANHRKAVTPKEENPKSECRNPNGAGGEEYASPKPPAPRPLSHLAESSRRARGDRAVAGLGCRRVAKRRPWPAGERQEGYSPISRTFPP